MMTFIEFPTFTRQVSELMTDEEYAEVQQELIENPEKGDLIKGLGGLRKVRVAVGRRGKSGGVRFIYLLLLRHEAVFFFYAYSKGDVSDLSSEQRKRLVQAVTQIKQEYRA